MHEQSIVPSELISPLPWQIQPFLTGQATGQVVQPACVLSQCHTKLLAVIKQDQHVYVQFDHKQKVPQDISAGLSARSV